MDGFDRCCGKILKLLHKVEMSGVWSTNESPCVCSSLQAPHLKDLPTLLRWWWWLTALAVVERRIRHTVIWDARSKYVAGRAEWGALLGVEALHFQGAGTGDRYADSGSG